MNYDIRLNKIKGQLNGIEKMLKDERACMDVVQQIVAVRAALSNLGVEILKDEANTCLKNNDNQINDIIEKLFKIT